MRDYPPVNVLGPGVPEGIINAPNRPNAEPDIKVTVLIGAGRSFITL